MYSSSSSSSFKFTLSLMLSSLLLHTALGEITCEEMPVRLCAYSISGTGKRCVMEKDEGELQCKTSEVEVEGIVNHVETDECVVSCGVDRNTVGISSDTLLEPGFASKLCSRACFDFCPNLVDLYFDLADAEGASLPELCEAHRVNPNRSMIDILSSGAAPGPVSATTSAEALAPAPAPM